MRRADGHDARLVEDRLPALREVLAVHEEHPVLLDEEPGAVCHSDPSLARSVPLAAALRGRGAHFGPLDTCARRRATKAVWAAVGHDVANPTSLRT